MDTQRPRHVLLDPGVIESWWKSASSDDREALRMYFGEAVFFERVLSSHVAKLTSGSTIVEIGSGIGLLSHLLSARGVRVIMFEPEGTGFGRTRQLFELVSAAWRGPSPSLEPHWEPFSPVALTGRSLDMVYALNVIEHVPHPASMVAEATALLSPGGLGRFVCPNYLFPYEPHYGIPTLWNKRVTHLALGKVIEKKALGLWEDLSWPTAGKLSRALSDQGVEHDLSRDVFGAYLQRLRDPYFLERKGRAFRALARMEPAIRRSADLIPRRALPIIDLTTRPTPQLRG